MRYFIIIFALFIATISIAQPGGRLIRIKVGKGEPGSTGLTGPAGADGTMGTDGREVEMQNNGTYIQWRYVGDVSWTNLIAISTLEGTDGTDGVDGIMGADGKEIELQNSGTYIQWRYVGDVSWINLISIAAITGADGTDGVDGMDGSIWHDGTGIPSGGLGSNGDYYLNNTNGDVYNKIAGTWTYVTNIKGTDGIGAGTVTIVTGSAPVVITSVPTATPNVTVDTTSNIGLFTQYDGSLKQDRILGTAGQTLRLSATNTVSASSLLYNNGSSIGINNTSPSGSLTVDGASYFNSQFPFNLYNSAGTGIFTSFTDGAYLDNLVYSGLRKTFTLGYASGGGLSISDNSLYKKLHVNGGVSIGEGIYNGTIAQNSLVVEGSATVQTRTGTATTLSGYDINGKFCTPSLGSGLTITGGALTYTNNAIQNLNGQTGTTQSFSYAATGTYPSWLSSGDVHTFRFPGGSAGQLIFHNGTGWTAGTPDYMSSWLLAASGTGGTEAITNGETFTINAGSGISANRSGNIVTITNTGDGSSSNELQTLSTTGAAGNITISSGNTITLNVNDADASTTNELQTVSNTSNSTSHTVTLSNSGGSTQFVEDTGISFTTSGTGLNGIVAIKNEGDLLVTNEGSLTVAVGASNTSIINSNTTGSTGVTITAGTGLGSSEAGNNITLTNSGVTSNVAGTGISVSGATGAVTITNTGVTSLTAPASGIALSASTGAITMSLNNDLAAVEGMSGTGIAVRTGTNAWDERTITSGYGISVSNGDGVSGNPTIENLHSSYCQLLYWGINTALTTTESTLTGSTGVSSYGTWTYDLPNGTVTIPTTGRYRYAMATNCKCDATKKVTFYLKRGTDNILISNHYYDNTSMYNEGYKEIYWNGTAGDVIKINIKDDSGTSNLQDCRIEMLVQRIY